ncbi:hypothetical protein [Enterobacter ludwigii]|uniref:hypothetical protein n=1 Tax=Enterobacter ludwigii TaxID=299767 RepID=UPI0018C2E7F4|nr:hypothetical protein [Enterobacter ludwigii]
MNRFMSVVLLSSITFNVFSFDVELTDNVTMEIKNSSAIKKIHLDTIVNGYTVKCDGSKIVVWGKPVKFNESNPQDTNIIITNLNESYKTVEKRVSEGVFGIEYLKGKDNAFIDAGNGLFVNLTTGQLDEVKSEFDSSDENNFESCDKNKSWEFNRYN